MRLRPPEHPVTITFDGAPVIAERGEPIAAALVAAGHLVVARSPKFHRPRGPACFRGACDGCLARVDDVPNVMTCLASCEEGTAVVSQNHLGPRETDLLGMTDWFFPGGMNHHELFAGVPGIQTVMQAFARKVAGLGRLPKTRLASRPATRRQVDVLVVGAGPSGLGVARALVKAGRTVEIVDDRSEPGGSSLAAGFTFERIDLPVRTRTVAGAIYGRDVLVVGPEGAEIVEPKTLVLACGAHDGVAPFEGNDRPGVMSARAGAMLLARGVIVGARTVVVVPEGGGPFGEAYVRVRPEAELLYGEPIRVHGARRPRSVVVRTPKGEVERKCDAVLIDAPPSPSFELAEQAGAELVHAPNGFLPRNIEGRIRPGVWAVGELTGTPFEPAAIARQAEKVARSIVDEHAE